MSNISLPFWSSAEIQRQVSETNGDVIKLFEYQSLTSWQGNEPDVLVIWVSSASVYPATIMRGISFSEE